DDFGVEYSDAIQVVAPQLSAVARAEELTRYAAALSRIAGVARWTPRSADSSTVSGWRTPRRGRPGSPTGPAPGCRSSPPPRRWTTPPVSSSGYGRRRLPRRCWWAATRLT